MGQELDCKARFAGRTAQGKALLETDYLLFRADFRIKIPFGEMSSVEARDGWLKMESKQGLLALQLGAASAKWAQKILHPPSRADKLRIKAGMVVTIAGGRRQDLAREIEERGATLKPRPAAGSDLIFLG